MAPKTHLLRKYIPYEMKKLGSVLKQLREEMGLSMHEVARRNKSLAPSFISKIEAANALKSITVNSLIAFANVYEVPINVLLEKAGFLDKEEEDLPGLATYLKIKYNAPYQLIKDIEIAWEVLKAKYEKQKSSSKKDKSNPNQWTLWDKKSRRE